MPKYIEKLQKLKIPVIPLRGIVAFPSLPINFELERDISKLACEAAEKDDMLVFLLTQKDINTDAPEETDLYTVGCVAKIKQTLKKPAGNIRVIAEGLCRGTVSKIYNENGYLTAEVISKTIHGDFSKNDLRTEALIQETIAALNEMLRFIPSSSDEFLVAANSITNPGLLADFIASNVFIRYQDKETILEEYDPVRRAEQAIILMENEIKLLEMGMDIQRKVKKAVDDNQREYYLREQLKVIEDELGIDDDVDEYTKKLEKLKLPEEVRQKLDRELLRLEKTPQGSPEAAVCGSAPSLDSISAVCFASPISSTGISTSSILFFLT